MSAPNPGSIPNTNPNANMERFYAPFDIYAERSQPKLSSAYICLKIVLLISNLVFMIFACILIGVGSYALNNRANSLADQTLPTGLIVIGVFIMLVSLIGALSAWKENTKGLLFYFVILLLITIVLFAVAIAVYSQRNNADSLIDKAWHSSSADVHQEIQNALSCCGLFNNTDTLSPSTCTAQTNNTPCFDPLVDAFHKAFKAAGATGIAFAVIMFSGMFIVCCLVDGIRKNKLQKDLNTIRRAQDGSQQQTMFDPQPRSANMVSQA